MFIACVDEPTGIITIITQGYCILELRRNMKIYPRTLIHEQAERRKIEKDMLKAIYTEMFYDESQKMSSIRV